MVAKEMVRKDAVGQMNNVGLNRIFTFGSLILLVLMALLCFNTSIWKDEVFDLEMISHSYSYFLLSARDSAPPFHFMILKFIVESVLFFFPSANTIIVAKLTSVIPYVVILALSHTEIKKIYGSDVASLFSFLTLAMPHCFGLGFEIRQYSWSMLLSLVWFIVFAKLIETSRTKYIIGTLIMGPMVLFSHYYAFFGIAFAYLFVMIKGLKDRDSKSVRNIVIIMLGSVLIFSVWLIIALEFIFNNMTQFQIFITSRNILSFILYHFAPDSSKYNIDIICAFVFYILFIYVCIVFFKQKKQKLNNHIVSIIGLGIPFFTLVCGIVIGVFIAPCFQPRYLMPMIPCFWLSFADVLRKINIKKMLFVLIYSFIGIVSAISILKVTKDELIYKKNIIQLQSYLDTKEEGKIYVDNYRLASCLPYYTDLEIIDLSDPDELQNNTNNELLALKDNCFFLSQSETIDDLSRTLFNTGGSYKFEPVFSSGIEYVFFTVYASTD